MAKSTVPSIRDWVNQDLFNVVEIRGHVSGVRVNLKTSMGEISFSSAGTIEEGFKEAYRNSIAGERVLKQRRIRVLKEHIFCS